jgi:hypothetical protein
VDEHLGDTVDIKWFPTRSLQMGFESSVVTVFRSAKYVLHAACPWPLHVISTTPTPYVNEAAPRVYRLGENASSNIHASWSNVKYQYRTLTLIQQDPPAVVSALIGCAAARMESLLHRSNHIISTTSSFTLLWSSPPEPNTTFTALSIKLRPP